MDKTNILKIELGGGENPYGHGFFNVDVRPLPTVDIQCDLRQLIFSDESIEEVFTTNVLEHFLLNEAIQVLKEAFRVLKVGGKITIIVPDLRQLMQDYMDKRLSFEKFNRFLYGSQEHSYNIHRSNYTFEDIKKALESIGFQDIKRQSYSLAEPYEGCPMLEVVAFKKTALGADKKENLRGENKMAYETADSCYMETEGKAGDHIERIVPHVVGQKLYVFHLKRYKFAASFLRQKNILDVGCGTGYGSFLLASEAAKVTGIDISEKAIGFAKEHYLRDNLSFHTMGWSDMPGLNSKFDGIVALEFFEHIDEHEKFLEMARTLLEKEGLLILSTPNRNRSEGSNPFHAQEFNPYELESVLNKHFKNFTLYGQFIRPEYYKLKERYFEEIPRYVARSFVPEFIRRFIPRKSKANYWKKVRQKAGKWAKEESGSPSTAAQTQINMAADLVGFNEEDILITSSKKDVWSCDFVLAVCRK